MSPRTRVLVYNANNIHHGALVPPAAARPDAPGSYLCGLDNFKPEWRATYDNGTAYTVHGGTQYVHNLSIPAARAWWIDVITNRSLGDNVHGVFADNGLDQAPTWCAPERAAALLRGQQALLQMFLQVQISAVVADGKMHPAEHEMLMRIARGLGLSEAEVRQLEAMLLGGGRASEASSPQRLENAYRVLGVSPSAPDAEVKKAYRRLMSQNHPDKLAAKGLPESMRQMAEQKTREITGAYEIVERARAKS